MVINFNTYSGRPNAHLIKVLNVIGVLQPISRIRSSLITNSCR